MLTSHLSFFDRVSGVMVSNQLGFPLCEIVFRIEPDPEEFQAYDAFYSLLDVSIQLDKNIVVLNIPAENFRRKFNSFPLSLDDVRLLQSQKHPEVMLLLVCEFRGNHYRRIIADKNGSVVPLRAKLVKNASGL